MQAQYVIIYMYIYAICNTPSSRVLQTDDQILLLQNCWSDILALGVCWWSSSNPCSLRISVTHSITQEQAEHLGCGGIVQPLLTISSRLQQLSIDRYEYAALKVLLLLSPGKFLFAGHICRIVRWRILCANRLPIVATRRQDCNSWCPLKREFWCWRNAEMPDSRVGLSMYPIAVWDYLCIPIAMWDYLCILIAMWDYLYVLIAVWYYLYPDRCVGLCIYPDSCVGVSIYSDSCVGLCIYPDSCVGVSIYPDSRVGLYIYPDSRVGLSIYPAK